jgi:hypothetical protein
MSEQRGNRFEEIHTPRSPGTCILFAHADTLIALERTTDAGEHPNALYHLRAAVDSLERAHRALVSTDGTAILKDGEAEPVETWPQPYPTPPAVALYSEPKQR